MSAWAPFRCNPVTTITWNCQPGLVLTLFLFHWHLYALKLIKCLHRGRVLKTSSLYYPWKRQLFASSKCVNKVGMSEQILNILCEEIYQIGFQTPLLSK